jgi:hypothetical protein
MNTKATEKLRHFFIVTIIQWPEKLLLLVQSALPTFVRCKTGQKNIKGGTKGYFV